MSDFDNKPSGADASDSEAGIGRLGSAEDSSGLAPATEPLSTVPAVLTPSASVPSVHKRGGRPALTLERLSRLKELYFGFETMEAISAALGMSIKTIHKHVHRVRESGLSWAQQRAEQQRMVAESVMSNSSHLIQQASDRSIRLLHLGLQEFHRNAVLDPSSVTLQALEKVASIAEKLDRLNRLEGGRPTSIHSLSRGEPISKEKTDAIIKADPFTVAEFSEVNE